ncbi:lytic polysaccharide monooxygenase [Photobacterium sp. TLY01]|uniref:lytic polysaccharide monooxygenase n=1 Tax=Photobacterium sp. TLY01 TaxID=2907534 RepID=UPI0027299344|nr:lytic polysaccharide monooxygenase [Photobacterium sp. TLY01]
MLVQHASWRKGLLCFAITSVLSSLSATVHAHGYMDYPPARQEICDRDGGYWDTTDGSTIPNAACRAAFLQSGWYPFIQKPEFARLVSDYNNQAAVEQAIPDGSLCSGADSKKSGIDLPSPYWQKTLVELTDNGQLTLLYRAETPHSPSFWKFYLSKPGFDSAAQPLAWSDLDLVAEVGNVPTTTINGLKYYQMTITLPTDRTGDAVLFTRWQRADPAGEGFYNCSDIRFAGTDSGQPDSWTSAGAYVKATDIAQPGESAWFRIFDHNGQETVSEQLAITTANQAQGIWAEDLAATINQTYPQMVQVGKQDSGGTIAFDAQDLFGNQVFLKNQGYTYQLDIKVVPAAPEWIASQVYVAGDKVLYQGQLYTAKWWTKGDQPGQADVWQLN